MTRRKARIVLSDLELRTPPNGGRGNAGPVNKPVFITSRLSALKPGGGWQAGSDLSEA